MLFFTRAFLCIGTVVVLAEGFGPNDLLKTSRDAAGALSGSASASLEGLCRARPADCLAVVKAAVTAGEGAQTADGAGKPNEGRPASDVLPSRGPRHRSIVSGLSSETRPLR